MRAGHTFAQTRFTKSSLAGLEVVCYITAASLGFKVSRVSAPRADPRGELEDLEALVPAVDGLARWLGHT